MISRFNPDPRQMNLTYNINGNEVSIGSIGAYTFINSMNLDVNYDKSNFVANLHIGKYCSIAKNLQVSLNRNHDYKSISTVNKLWLSELFYDDNNTISIKQKGQVIIGSDTWIGDNVTILSGINIGSGAVIGQVLLYQRIYHLMRLLLEIP